MAGKKRVSVGDVADILGAGRQSERKRSEGVRVGVVVARDAPPSVVSCVRSRFVPELPGGHVEVLPLGEEPAPGTDCALVLAGADAPAALAAARRIAGRGVPVAIAVESVLDRAEEAMEPTDLVSYVAGANDDALGDAIATWAVGACGEKGIALAANFPFCRAAKVRELVRACALGNAAVGAVGILPGADLPVMTASQAKLVLDIAAACGRPLRLERVADLAGVLGAGFLYRAIARALVGLVPGVGWALKAGVGYAGTVATARAMELRLGARGLPPSSARARVGQALEGLRDIARERLSRPTRAGAVDGDAEGRYLTLRQGRA